MLSSPQFSLFTAVHKHYSLEQWKEFASQNPDCLEVTQWSRPRGPQEQVVTSGIQWCAGAEKQHHRKTETGEERV